MSSNNLLDVPVEREIKVDEKSVTFIFKKDTQAKILLQNLSDMQARDGMLTDVIVSTRRKDYKEKFHSMLLAVCSPTVKGRLVARNANGSKGDVVLEELTKKMLHCFKEFIYKCEFTTDEDTLDDLHNFAVQFDIDSLTTMCEEFDDQQGRITVMPDDHEDVLSELFSMFLEKELTTAILEDDKGKIQLAVHGPLIAAASPALQEILLQGPAACGRQPIRLGIPSVVLGDFIGYIYSAKVTLQRENAVGLLRAACTYEIPALAKACCKWLTSKLETYDVVGILCLVRELDSENTADLEEITKNYIITNFSRLSTEDEFSALDPEDLKEIIQDDKLEVDEEEDVFTVVMNWIAHDEENRLHHLSELLSCVRLEQTSMAFLNEVQQDPRIGSSPRCLQVIEEVRQKLIADEEVYSTSHSSSYDDEGFQEIEGSLDGVSSHGLPEDEFPADHHGLSSASYGGAAYQEDVRDTSLRDSYPRDDGPRDGYPHDDERDESYSHDSFSRNSYLHGSFLPHSYPHDGDPRDEQHDDSCFRVSHSRNSYLHDGLLPHTYPRDSDPPDDYPRDDDRDDSFSRDSYPCGRYLPDGYDSYSSNSHEFVSYRPRRPRPDMRRKENRELYLDGGVNKNGTPDKRLRENRREFTGLNGYDSYSSDSHKFVSYRPRKPRRRITDFQPDMRCKENRELYLDRGVNKNGDPDKRLRENRRELTGLNKDGTCDMRFKVNKELLGDRRRTEASTSTNRPKKVGPLNKDGTPDMRCKVNRAALTSSYRSSSPCGGISGTPSVATSSSWETPFSTVYTSGPLKKNGTPDMRYTVNKQRYGDNSAATSASRGPLKKDGTPDMRYAANRRQSHNSPTPPSQARGPLKKNGTPDMRFKANRR